MFTYNNKRINIYAAFTTPDGARFANLTDPQVRETVGVVEITEPAPPADFSDDTHYRTEQDEAPFVVYTKKSPEQLEQLRKNLIIQSITRLEAEITPRRVREALMGDTSWLVQQDAKIDELRAQLQGG